MIEIKNPADCCGCTACASVCTHDAIIMKPNVLGFLYPEIDKDKCTDCGLCEKVCAFHSGYNIELNLDIPEAYAAKHIDKREIETSQSGAAFIALSDWILEQGGIVYGVGYKDHFRVAHKKVTTKLERNEFKGSKYVQSDLDSIFKQVKEDLKNGSLVLFTGTPCQTAGLSSFIGKKLRENLFLMDIVCHGVSAPFVWRDYLNYLERKEHMQITAVNFRDKRKFGWHSHVESFLFNNVYTYTYTYTFYTHIMLRNSCGECPYTNTRRPSDVTVADFWGIEKTIAAEMGADNKGCSLMLVNTEKGKQWFEAIKKNLEYKKVPIEDCLQPQLRHPSVLHPQRIAFENDYEKLGFEKTLKKYGFLGWKNNWKCFRKKLSTMVIQPFKNSIREIVKNK